MSGETNHLLSVANYPNLEHLFYSGNIEECIIQGEQYLKEDPEDIDVLLLLATAYHDIVFYDDSQTLFDAIQNFTIPYVKRVLAIDPKHERALQHILHYPLQHQQLLIEKQEKLRHITTENNAEYIAYARQLLQYDELLYNAYNFLWQIYETLEEPENQLQLANEAIAALEKEFDDSRSGKDYYTSIFWIRKIVLLNSFPGVSKDEIYTLIESRLQYLVSKDDTDFITLAEIAYQTGRLDLPIKLLSIALQNDRSLQVIGDVAEQWYARIGDELNTNADQPDLYIFQLKLERNYADFIDVADDLYYDHALHAITQYPKDYFGYHFAGIYLFEIKEYKQAISLFEKAIALHPIAETVRCYIECYLYVQHKIPDIPQMKSHPKEIYEEATYLDDWEDDVLTAELYDCLCKARLEFYEQAYLTFHDFLDNNAYQSYFDCHYMLFAMCCLNLSTVHSELDQYIQSAAIAEEALRHANFWELHSIRIESLIRAKLFEDAKIAVDIYFDTVPQDEIPFLKHLIFLANRVEVNYELSGGQDVFEDCKILLNQIYDYGVAHPDMNREEYSDVEIAKTAVQNVFYDFVEKLKNTERIEIFQQHANRYPKEAHPQYMLMQLYHEIANYKLSNQAAYAYLSNKVDFAISPFDKARAINYILRTHVVEKEYDRATIIFDENYRFVKDELTEIEFNNWLLYSIELKFELQQYDELHPLVETFVEHYKQNNWPHDKEMQKVLLWEASSLHEEGKSRQAIKILDDLRQYTNHDPVIDEYKAQWKKKSFFSRFRFK